MTQQKNNNLLIASLNAGILAAGAVVSGALGGHVMTFMMDLLSTAGVSSALVGAAAGAILALIAVGVWVICSMAVSGMGKKCNNKQTDRVNSEKELVSKLDFDKGY